MADTPICKIDTQRGYLDHLAKVGCDVRAKANVQDGIASVPGDLADEAGSLALGELARELNVPVLVIGPSEHHEGKTFEPRQSA